MTVVGDGKSTCGPCAGPANAASNELPVMVVSDGRSTCGPCAGPANEARNEETQPDFLPALKRQYEVDKQQQN